MDKKADWRQSLRQALKDKRLIGAGIAGLAGGAAGAFGLPDLIYKKPTTGSRVGLGVSTGLVSALITLAAMNKDKVGGAQTGKTLVDTVHNLPGAIFGERNTVPELKQMSWLSRALRGYGSNPLAWGVRTFRSAFPDAEGLVGGKSQRSLALQESGQLPKSPAPSPFLSWTKAGVNGGAGAIAAWLHGKRLANRWQNREVAKHLVDAAKDPGINTALHGTGALNRLKWLTNRTKPTGSDLKDLIRDTKNTAGAKLNWTVAPTGSNRQKVFDWINNKLFNPGTRTQKAISWLDAKTGNRLHLNQIRFNNAKLKQFNELNPNLSAKGVLDELTKSQPLAAARASNKSIDKLLEAAIKKPKMSLRRKVWTGTRAGVRGLAIMMALGQLQRLAGSSATMYNDTSRNLNLE